MEPKAGFKTTEFWFMVARMVAAAALTIYEPTRDIGIAMLGIGAHDGKGYLAARMDLKRGGHVASR